MTLHRFYVPPKQITGNNAVVLGDDADQIRRVLRLGPGARLSLFDGTGREWEAAIQEAKPSAIRVVLLAITYPATELPSPLMLLQALLKGEKMDWVVEKATELGASDIHTFPARRSVVQLREERSERKAQRWQRIAKEAAEQCGRVKVPAIHVYPTLKQAFLDMEPAQPYLADESLSRTASSSSESVFPRLTEPTALLVGPEGGWTPDEREQIYSQGAQPLSLGPRILRAETAAVVGLAMLGG